MRMRSGSAALIFDEGGAITAQSTVTVPAGVLNATETDFTLPPALADAPAGSVYTGGYVAPVGG